MATPIETAGLVLAAFPIVVSFLEHYHGGLKTLKEWWKFRTEFLQFLHEVGTQSVLFSENLEALLAPLVESELEMTALLEDPGGPAWHNPELEERVKERLPKSYSWYRLTITAIHDVLENLKKRLGIKPGTTSTTLDLKNKGKIRWEYEFARMRFTLGKSTRKELLDKLLKYNNDLQTMLGNSEKLAESRVRRRTLSFTVHHAHIRDHAHGLHQLLFSRWICECRDNHNAHLLLENRIAPKTGSEAPATTDLGFNVLLYFGDELPDVKQTRWSWHETRIKISGPWSLQPPSPTPSGGSAGLPKQPPSPSPSGSSTTRPKPPPSPSPSATSSAVRPKTVSRATDQTIPLQSPVPQRKASVGPRAQSLPTLDLLPHPASPGQKTPSPPPPYEDPDIAHIHDLCDAISRAQREHKCLGFLLDQRDRRYTFFPVAQPTVHSGDLEIVTLEDLLKDQQAVTRASTNPQHVLSRRDRLYIAALLSVSLLQLHSTPWLTGIWTKKNIFFTRVKNDPSAPIDTSKLYISPPVEFDGSQFHHHQTPNPEDATKYLFALGVMLLELCFGKAIEDNPARAQFMGHDGQPNTFTDFATARQWQQAALGEIGPDYAEAIRKCIYNAFPHPYNDLSDDRFVQAVYEDVVEPVKKTLRWCDPNAWEE